MLGDSANEKRQAHELIERLVPSQVAAVVGLLEVMVDPHSGEEPFTEEDRRAVAASREWFKKNPEGIPFEQILADCGITPEDVKNHQGD
jgi:hypothetical protein